MRYFLIILSFSLLNCQREHPIHNKILIQLDELGSYPDWPQKLCNDEVDSVVINSLAQAGLVNIKITNNSNHIVIFDLSGGPLCDSVYLYSPNSQLVFAKALRSDSLSSVFYKTNYGGKRVTLQKDSTKMILADCKPFMNNFSRVEFIFAYLIDSSNVKISKELKLKKHQNDVVEID